MLVLAQVSSMNTIREASNLGNCRRHVVRMMATSGLFCSAALKVFFCIDNRGAKPTNSQSFWLEHLVGGNRSEKLYRRRDCVW
jgi:hypothetical protein